VIVGNNCVRVQQFLMIVDVILFLFSSLY
jgi:hypothetical protein